MRMHEAGVWGGYGQSRMHHMSSSVEGISSLRTLFAFRMSVVMSPCREFTLNTLHTFSDCRLCGYCERVS